MTTTTTNTLPHAVTFYLTAEERRALLARLRRIDSDRSRALLAALKITTGEAR